MVKTKTLFACIVLLLICIRSPEAKAQTSEKYKAVIGKWELNLGADVRPTLNIFVKDNKLDGKFIAANGEYNLSKITFSKGKLEFEWVYPGEHANITMSYVADIKDNKMSDGKWYIDEDKYPAVFTGTKKK